MKSPTYPPVKNNEHCTNYPNLAKEAPINQLFLTKERLYSLPPFSTKIKAC